MFRLGDWQRIRQLYENYSFSRARKMLTEDVQPSMPRWFEDCEIASVDKLRHAMSMYEHWENGDYVEAFSISEIIKKNLAFPEKFKLPTAITALGHSSYWPHSHDAKELHSQLVELESGNNEQQSLYLDIIRLFIYICDEMEKIGRLIEFNEDFRSALLRGVGLTEVLMRARLLILLETDQVQVALKANADDSRRAYCSWNSADAAIRDMKKNVGEAIIKSSSMYRIINTLSYPSTSKNNKNDFECILDGIPGNRIHLRRLDQDGVPKLDEKYRLEDERNLRHKAIHTYLSVPRDIAERTLALVRQDVQNFRTDWAPLMNVDIPEVYTEHISWRDLCDACGVTFLPMADEA